MFGIIPGAMACGSHEKYYLSLENNMRCRNCIKFDAWMHFFQISKMICRCDIVLLRVLPLQVCPMLP
jgi:hypothetical protein